MPSAACRVHPVPVRFLLALAAMLLTCCGRGVTAPTKMEDEIPPRLDAAVARGLAFLARQQNADGSFEGGAPKVAMTGLAVLAFLGAGETPGLGKHGLVVHNSIEFLLGKQAPHVFIRGQVAALCPRSGRAAAMLRRERLPGRQA